MKIALLIVPVIGVLLRAIPSAMAQQLVQIPGEQPTGILLTWSTICNTGSSMGILLQSCTHLVNPDSTLTQAGVTAKACIANIVGLVLGATGVGLSYDSVISGINTLAGMMV